MTQDLAFVNGRDGQGPVPQTGLDGGLRQPPVLAPEQRTAYQRVAHLAHMGWLARCLHAVTRLGVADAIGDEPRSYLDLARTLAVDADALARVVRCLAGAGVFKDLGACVGHTEASRLLRGDHPLALGSVVRWAGSPVQWRAYGELERVLRTGQSAFAPEGLFKALEEQPAEALEFDRTMEAMSVQRVQAIARGYDFTAFATICDVGGGRGHLLSAILAATPKSSGVLVDLPEVVDRAPPASGRVVHAARDLLHQAPPPADLYVLKNVLHDWPDDVAARILGNIRSGAPAHAKIMIAETLLPDRPGPGPAALGDLSMLVLNGGRERTLGDFDRLFEASGFRRQEVRTLQDLSLIVAAP